MYECDFVLPMYLPVATASRFTYNNNLLLI